MNEQNAKTILVVEDDLDLLETLKVQLESAGYRVVAAETEKQAADALQAGRPDLAIVDLMLEHMDSGFVVCHRIKTKDSSTPVIILTAVTSETGLEFDATTDEERSWVKADVMLAKPVRFEQLRREIERLLARQEIG